MIAPPAIQGVEIKEDVKVGKYTSIGVDCSARALVRANSNEGLEEFLQWCQDNGEQFHILGGGTNSVFVDPEFDGYIIKLGQHFSDLKIESDRIRTGCAIPLSRLLKISVAENLTGLEFTWDIPGTLGGAICGNAGTADKCICDLVEAVKGFTPDGKRWVANRDGFEYTYRNTALRGLIITQAILKLEHSDPDQIEQNLAHFKEIRWIQPAGVKTAGCIFKNPEGHRAGKLIDEAGLKGYSIGGAMVSNDHANFMVNSNKATAEDVQALIDHIRNTIMLKHSIWLETEVQMIHSPHQS